MEKYSAYEQTVKDAIDFNLRSNWICPCCDNYSTGYIEYDELTNGIHPSELTLIAGRPGVGKTTFCLNIVQHMVLHNDIKVGMFFSHEAPERIANMLMAMEAHVKIKLIEMGVLSTADKKNVEDAAELFRRNAIQLNMPSYGDRIFDLETMFWDMCRYALSENVDIIFVDSLQYIDVDYISDERGKYTEIVKILRAAAIEFRIPIIVVSDISDESERRDDNKPDILDLRKYGPIDQYADTILFLHKDEYYHTDSRFKGVVDIIVAKHEFGETGEIQLLWLPEYLKYCNLERGG